MSVRSLEAEILARAKLAFKNPKLRQKDILEWSTGTVRPEDGEVAVTLQNGISVAIAKEHDKRGVPSNVRIPK